MLKNFTRKSDIYMQYYNCGSIITISKRIVLSKFLVVGTIYSLLDNVALLLSVVANYLVGCIVQKRININVDYTTKVTFCQKIAGSHQQLEYYYNIRNLPYGSYGIAQQVKCFLTFSNLIQSLLFTSLLPSSSVHTRQFNNICILLIKFL